MLSFLKSLFKMPQPAGPPELIRSIGSDMATISRDGIRLEGDAWVIDAPDTKTARLFEVGDLDLEQCIVTYRAKMKCEGLVGRAYLEMWCRVPGRGEFFSKGLNQTLGGSQDWATFEIPFFLKKGQRPDMLKLNVVIEGKGQVWIKNIELFRTPLET